MSGTAGDLLPGAERLSTVACLAVRFWDPATATPVVDGLRVSELSSGRVARPTRSGAFVLWQLPGLGDAERGAGDASYWRSPPASRRCTVVVVDELGRYLDCRFEVVAPARGTAGPSCTERLPAGTPQGTVPLFSRPARPVPAGHAAVRAELVDGVRSGPAARCVVTVTPPGGPPTVGVSDDRGRVLVVLPVPEPVRSLDSPPSSGVSSWPSWTVGLEVRRTPGGLPDDDGRDAPPALCDLLDQPPARLTTGLPEAVPVTSAELVLGRDLLLDEGHGRVLLVLPAA